ncbi:hypothetical protein PIB30_006096 [Stylosanthes scabra]|uniref:Uncharacterized protein n=1 Tax=Stylosanthes scabra TaxID=79078 RepID=A0ABU6W3P6_9FABA|nr:hypothetical protein [Stylosanthes scabra]
MTAMNLEELPCCDLKPRFLVSRFHGLDEVDDDDDEVGKEYEAMCRPSCQLELMILGKKGKLLCWLLGQ